MTASELERREALLARSDAALDRWPERSGPDFTREMTAVAESLASLAQAAGAREGDPIEAARSWRHAGIAYFDLAAGRERAQLERAAAAFARAETLLGDAVEPVERVTLAYSFGQTLMCLSDAKDVRLVRKARDRFAGALPLARAHMPEGAASLEKVKADADRVIALLGQAERLGRRIDQLKAECSRPAPTPQPAPGPPAGAPAIQALLGVPRREFEKDKPAL